MQKPICTPPKPLASVLKQVHSVRQLIYTGSYAVYGDREGAWVDEASPVAPANPNGQILCETEQVLLSASSDDSVCILRLGGIYGPRRELVKIFGRVAGTIRPGNGEDATNWIHLDDIVAAIKFARQHRLHLQLSGRCTSNQSRTARQSMNSTVYLRLYGKSPSRASDPITHAYQIKR